MQRSGLSKPTARTTSRNQPGGIWTRTVGACPGSGVIYSAAPCVDGQINMHYMNQNGMIPGDFSGNPNCTYGGPGPDNEWNTGDDPPPFVYVSDYYGTPFNSYDDCLEYTPGCEYTPSDVCNTFWADECGGGCTAYEDSACSGWGSNTTGYACCTQDQNFDNGECSNIPFTGPGLGWRSGDSTGDGTLNVTDVVNTIAWIVCGSGDGIIPENPEDMDYVEGCVPQCTPGPSNPYCPAGQCDDGECVGGPDEGNACSNNNDCGGWVSFEELTHELLLNADMLPPYGQVNVLDVISLIDAIVNPRDRALAERELQKLIRLKGSKITSKRIQPKRSSRTKPPRKGYNKGGKVNTNTTSRFSGRTQTNPKGKSK